MDGGEIPFTGLRVKVVVAGDVQDQQVARAIVGIAGLQSVVEPHTEDISRLKIVDVPRRPETERPKIRGKTFAAVDRRNAILLAIGAGNVAVAQPGCE